MAIFGIKAPPSDGTDHVELEADFNDEPVRSPVDLPREEPAVVPNPEPLRMHHVAPIVPPHAAVPAPVPPRAPIPAPAPLPLGRPLGALPRAPPLLYSANFAANAWLIPDLPQLPSAPVSAPVPTPAVAPGPVATSAFATPTKPAVSHSPAKENLQPESPNRSIMSSPLASPVRVFQRLRKGPIDDQAIHVESESSVSEQSPKRPAKRRERSAAGDLFDLEAVLSGEEEEEEADDEIDEASWITDSGEPSSGEPNVNMQAVYRQSLLTQVSPTKGDDNGKLHRPGADGFAGAPKRHHENHYKMRFLDETAKARHAAALVPVYPTCVC